MHLLGDLPNRLRPTFVALARARVLPPSLRAVDAALRRAADFARRVYPGRGRVLVLDAPIEALALAHLAWPDPVLALFEPAIATPVAHLMDRVGAAVEIDETDMLADLDRPRFEHLVHAGRRSLPAGLLAQATREHRVEPLVGALDLTDRTCLERPVVVGPDWLEVGRGDDCIVLRRGDDVVRRAHHPVQAGELAAQRALTDWLAPRLPCPLPRFFELQVTSTVALARTTWLPGRPARRDDFTPQLAEQLADVLSVLHTLPVAAAPPAAELGRRLDTTPAGARARVCAWRRMDPSGPTRTDLPPTLERLAAELLAAEPPAPPRAQALIHGDLDPSNLLIADGQLAGILDWNDACIGDPRRDLGDLMAFGDDAFGARLLAVYRGPLGPDDLAAIDFYRRLQALDHALGPSGDAEPLEVLRT